MAVKSAKRRTQAERTAHTRRKLIDAATSCIADHGVGRTTIDDIATRAGVTSGAVQHHFGTRNELIFAVIEDFGRWLSLPEADRYIDIPAISERVSRIFDHYWEIFTSRRFYAIFQIWLGSQKDAPIFAKVLDEFYEFEIELDRQWIEVFSDCISNADHIVAARHVAIATMRGLAYRSAYTRNESNSVTEIELLKRAITCILEDEASAPRAHHL